MNREYTRKVLLRQVLVDHCVRVGNHRYRGQPPDLVCFPQLDEEQAY